MRQYSPDLTPPWKKTQPVPEVPAEPGLVVEEPGSGFCGAVIRCEAGTVTLEDRFGKHRVFPMQPRGFLLEGRPVTLVKPASGPVRPTRQEWPYGSAGSDDSTEPGARLTDTASTALSSYTVGSSSTGPSESTSREVSRTSGLGRSDSSILPKLPLFDGRENV